MNRYVLSGWEEVPAIRSRRGRSWPSDFLNRENAREEKGQEVQSVAQRIREVMAFRFRSKGYDLKCAGEVWCA